MSGECSQKEEVMVDLLFDPGINPLVTNGLSHPNHLHESTFILKGIKSNLSYYFSF